MAEVVEAQRGHARKGKKKKKRRLGIRIDMTPMVDIAFLLLTFFMLTTSMTKPSTMEINLPPDVSAKVEVAESNLMTLRVREDGKIFWNMGIESAKEVKPEDLRKLLNETFSANPKLIVLVKIDRKNKFNMLVDIIDELNLAKIQRFSIAPLLDQDK
ncbi:MAG: biopolymer transporter ExbD, partial [Ignavibacteria bacterium]|nr:biopolymer transporter ExbD [Ignavibacteria bacterium]